MKTRNIWGTTRQYDQTLELKRGKLQNSLSLLLIVATISDKLHTPELECSPGFLVASQMCYLIIF